MIGKKGNLSHKLALKLDDPHLESFRKRDWNSDRKEFEHIRDKFDYRFEYHYYDKLIIQFKRDLITRDLNEL